jgi:HTH-type transcriptional regulator/antitoxin HigA
MGAEPGTTAADELDVLATLVDAYETKHFPMATPDPVTIIKFQMEQQGLTRKDLEPMIGSRGRVSEVLTGKRSLTLPMIRRLHAGLYIPVDLLIGSSPTAFRVARSRKRKLPVAAQRESRRSRAQMSIR